MRPTARAARGRPGGIGRASSAAAERISDDLRLGSSEHLKQRRRAAALVLAASSSMSLIALYQFGLIRHLPDPPRGPFDSDRVDASGEAYQAGLTPDTTLALASYGVTLALIGMGPADRAQRSPWIPLGQTAKLALDVAGAAWLTMEQGSKHRRFCFWCVAAAATTAGALPLSLPEARRAWRRLRS